MGKYYLAIDMGASSGRHILGYMEDGKMKLEEIHRFDNGMMDVNGSKCWDTEKIFSEIIIGMKKCKELGKIPTSVAIDTWGVDFVLIGKDGKRLGNAVGYRDKRTVNMDKEVYKHISETGLYERTGIQKQLYNTIYQLMALKVNEPQLLEQVDKMLFTPDYYNYLLTGVKAAEYTIATTGQLINPITKDWDYDLIDCIGIPKVILPNIHKPGTVIGTLLPDIIKEIGYDCNVIMPAAHDTASAVMAVPAMGIDSVYISSGTWSLMGVELKDAICTKESMRANFTNEGGYEFRYRFLKNIMGLWMIQSVRHEAENKYSYAELCDMAKASEHFLSRVDVDDQRFFAPENMTEELCKYCEQTSQTIPKNIGEMATMIYHSLAMSYKKTIKEIEELTGKSYEAINIIGGGSNADYLNELTAKYTGKVVYAGPTEATAIGNLVAQMIADDVFLTLDEARKNIFESFEVKTYN